jgi:HK97 family phage portal protein
MNVLTLFSRGLLRFVTTGFRVLRGEQYKDPMSTGGRGSLRDVTDERGLQLSTVWACHTLLVDTVAMLPLRLYRRRRGSTPEEVRDHAVLRVVQRQATASMSSYDLMTALTFNLVAYGNAFAYLTRDAGGDVVDLFPLQASMVKTLVQPDGSLAYTLESDAGERTIQPERMLHVRGFGYSGFQGLSTFGFMRRTLAVAAAMQEHGGKFFDNGGRPSGVFTIDKVLKPEQREAIREQFLQKIEGQDNAFRTLVLEAGMRYERLGYSPEDMLLVDQQQFNAEELCRFFRIPPQLVGVKVEGTAYTGLEQLNLAFITYTLRPLLSRLAHALTVQLLRPEEQVDTFFEFDVTPLLMADHAALATYYAQMTQNGLMSRNEVRARMNLPPVEGGDALTAQTNLAPLDKLGEQPARGAPPQDAGQPLKQSEPVPPAVVHVHVPEFKIEPVPVYVNPAEPATVVVAPEVHVPPAPPAPKVVEKVVVPNDDGSWTVKEKLQ